MSDVRLRQLERRWRETGSIHDESALINERRRVGRITPAHLWAAGLLGSAAARIAMGQHATWGDDLAWGYALEEHHVAVRATLLVLDDLCSTSRIPPRVEQMRHLVRRWLTDPHAVSKDDISVLGSECNTLANRIWGTPYANPYGEFFEREDAFRFQLASFLGRLIHQGMQRGKSDLLHFLSGARDAVPAFRDNHIREVLRRGLVPWLLGHGDPLNIDAHKAGSS